METLGYALNLRTQALCTCTHTWACVHTLGNYERQVFCIKIKVWNESYIVWKPFQTPNFLNIKSHTWYIFKTYRKF